MEVNPNATVSSGIDHSLVIPVTEATEVGAARRMVGRLAQKIGLSETQAGKVSLIVTEAANNLVKHVGHGHLVVRALRGSAGNGLEMLALDKGRGMADLKECMRDGYSTAGSPGTGLGAIVRLSSTFDIYSNPGSGTVLLSRVCSDAANSSSPRVETGVISTAVQGEDVCGDSWSLHEEPGRTLILMVDGLGHGCFAAEAASAAVRIFNSNTHHPPAEILQKAHGALRSTRGAALAIAEIKSATSLVRYAGVGNIAATVASGGATRSLVSHNGTVGHEMRRVQEFTYPWPAGALLIMHSDGLQTRWTFANYPGLASRHAATVAGVIYRDFQRGRDDATVLVMRERREQ